MKKFFTVALVVAAAGFGSNALAGQFYGGKSIMHTNSALLLPPGGLEMTLYTRAFAGTDPNTEETYTNGTSVLTSAFGFSPKMEIGFTQIMYQDLNATPDVEDEVTTLIPGNTYLRFKYGGFKWGEKITWSGIGALRYRVGKYQNVHLEPYQGDAIEIELQWVMSYFDKPLYPDEGTSYHINLGVINHNDDEENPVKSAQEFQFLASALYPNPKMDFGAELYGSFFYIKPAESVLSREPWMYISPFVRYKFNKKLSYMLAFDLLVLKAKDTTVPSTDPLPNYPGWRIAGKLAYTPSTAFLSTNPAFMQTGSSAGPSRSRGEARRERVSSGRSGGDSGGSSSGGGGLFRWGSSDAPTGDIQAVDLDLEKIRAERKRAEDELNALKAKIEERANNAEQK